MSHTDETSMGTPLSETDIAASTSAETELTTPSTEIRQPLTDEPERILAIGAHPDDIELGGGGTIAKFAQSEKSRVKMLVLSEGEGKGYGETRRDEAYEAAEIMGVGRKDLDVLQFRDTEFVNSRPDIMKAIEFVAKAFKPTLVFTHGCIKGDHLDHLTTGRMTLIAIRNLQCDVLLYESLFVSQIFELNVFSDITDFMETKISAVRAHSSQRLSINLVEARATIRGDQMYRAHGRLAEAFRAQKMILRG